MEIIFLGTSSGTPTKFRNVSGLAIKSIHGKRWSLVDCGEGTQHQILRTGLSLANLESIYITHVHGDHCYGLPGLLASAAMAGKTGTLTLVGPADIQRFVEGVLVTTQVRLSYELVFIAIDSARDSIPLAKGEAPAGIRGNADYDVSAVALSHRVPSYGYIFTEQSVKPTLNTTKLVDDGIPQGPLWGKIQQGVNVTLPDGRPILAETYQLPARASRTVIVAGDNDMPSVLYEAAKHADVLVHEATYTESILEKVGPGPQHSSAKRVAVFAQDAGLPSLILTHFSPRYQDDRTQVSSIQDIEDEARAAYTGTLFLAKDFDKYHLQPDGALIHVTS